MENLSSKLRETIKNKPLNTKVRSDSKNLDNQFIKLLEYTSIRKNIKIPEIFDGRKAWDGLLPPVNNQGTCGSCWAFASTDVLASRFNIQSLGKFNVNLSAAKVVLCDLKGKEISISHPSTTDISRIESSSNGCYGNNILDACRYLYIIGTSTTKCVPYHQDLGKFKKYNKIARFSDIYTLPLCSNISGPYGDMCSDYYQDYHTGLQGGTPCRFYRSIHFYTLPGTLSENGSEKVLRDNIYKWGPILTGIIIYSDFYTFKPKNEIYKWDKKSPRVGGHAIVIVGWGEKNGEKYWIVKNSWGVEWGKDGYFFMVRGDNNCGIESNCMGMVPDFFYPENYTEHYNSSFYDIPKYFNQRKSINTDLDITAGGIDPSTGFTRRTMLQMPWIPYSPPIDYKKLPKWDTFIAGISADYKNRFYNQDKLAGNINKSTKKDKFDIFYLIFVIIISIIIISITIKIFFIK